MHLASMGGEDGGRQRKHRERQNKMEEAWEAGGLLGRLAWLGDGVRIQHLGWPGLVLAGLDLCPDFGGTDPRSPFWAAATLTRAKGIPLALACTTPVPTPCWIWNRQVGLPIPAWG